MFYEIKKESDRMVVCEKYVRELIKELDYQITQCDYTEDVNGRLVYDPRAYREERRELVNQRARWQTFLNMLTMPTPITLYGN